MYLVTYYHPLEGIAFHVEGVAETLEDAKAAVKHYFTGIPHKWQEFFLADQRMWIFKIDPGAGVQYVIQEVRVL